jgi:hypothetical protein
MPRQRFIPIFLVSYLFCVPALLLAGDVLDYPCYSIRESKRHGCFVCPVVMTPNLVSWKGQSIVITEAWVERKSQRVGPLGLLPIYKMMPGYNLCFKLSQGWDVLTHFGGPCFSLENAGHSFSQIGTVVLCESLDKLDRREFTILFSDNFKGNEPGAVRIKAVLDLQPPQTRLVPGR